jgi:predicted phosphodiesterase
MKILAVSDEVCDAIYTPLLKQKYGDVDLVLGCGDLPYYYLEFIVNALDVPLYYVPGNHDQKAQYMSDGRTLNRAEGCVEIDGHTAVVTGAGAAPARSPLLLAGLGGCLRYNDHGQHQYTQAEMYQRAWLLSPALLANRLLHGRFLDILITHAPPRGIHDRPTQAHTGLNAFLWLMQVFKPRFLLHGHTHRYRQDVPPKSRYLDTDIINVYPYRVVEWKA